MTKRRTFTDEFKREAVVLLESSSRPLIQVTAELGIQPLMLRSWRGTANGTVPAITTATMLRLPSPARSARLARHHCFHS